MLISAARLFQRHSHFLLSYCWIYAERGGGLGDDAVGRRTGDAVTSRSVTRRRAIAHADASRGDSA
jgi:hypothetical protein